MALAATVYTFDIELADTDRGVYETLALRVARHPSETEEFLVTRVLAYCLEYTVGLAFSKYSAIFLVSSSFLGEYPCIRSRLRLLGNASI